MEREPSPFYGTSAVRNSRAPPVLRVNVLYGMTGGDEAVGNGPNALASTTTSPSIGHLPVHLSRSATVSNAAAHVAPSSVRRTTMTDGVYGPNTAALSLTAANGTGSATSSPSLAKPVLDPTQVRCCPLDQWIPDAHVVNCMAPDCPNNFSLFNRKHRCRMCGRVFCASCCNNPVLISAAAAMPPAASTSTITIPDGGLNGNSVTVSSTNHHNNNSTIGAFNGSSTSLRASPEPTGCGAGALSAGGAAGSVRGVAAGGTCGTGENSAAAAGSVSTVLLSPTSAIPAYGMESVGNSVSAQGGFSSTNNNNGSNYSGNPLSAKAAASSPVITNVVQCRVCASCSYEVQLVVSTRQENGEPRRRSRGELKMLQRALLVNVMTYLNLLDLASVALVSADFYFMSRDNLIWYQYNMTRWVQEGEATQLSSLKSRAAALRAQQQQQQQQRTTSWYGGGSSAASSLADDIFHNIPVIQDATALSESEAAKRVISLHARYNYTQFLDFARRQEMARCEGLSSFSLGARILLSSPIRVALVGPSGIGKTAAVQAFLGEKPTQMVVRPTIGFQRRAMPVRLAGGLSTEVTLHIYDLSGADRYEELRRFVCRHCHVLALCYDPAQKVTLVQAADIMMSLEPALGPQPVVVCGLLRRGNAQASVVSNGQGVQVQPVVLASPHSTGTLEASGAKQRLELEEHNAQSAPLNDDRAGQGKSAVPLEATTARRAATEVFPEPGENNASAPLASPVDAAAAISMTDSVTSGVTSPALPRPLDTATAEMTGAESSSGGISGLPVASTPVLASCDVTVEDAVGITVRGLSSIQCPMMYPAPLFEAMVQAVLDRLGEATLGNTTTISEISAELTSQGEYSTSPSATPRGMGSVVHRSTPASVVRSSVRRRRPAASCTFVQDLLNLTMQPCALDILLDRK